VAEAFFEELKRCARFGPDDEQALRRFGPLAAPSLPSVVDEIFDRLSGHDEVRALFTGPAQIERIRGSLHRWLALLLGGPWDESYVEARAGLGGVLEPGQVPPRYIVGAINQLRAALSGIAAERHRTRPALRAPVVLALHKILDLDLAIMLESRPEVMPVSRVRYDQIVEEAEALITTIDPDGRVLQVNARSEEAIGVPRSRAIGSSWLDLFVYPADRRAAQERQEDALAGRIGPPFEGPVPRAKQDDSQRIRWHFTTMPGGAGGPLLCAIGFDVTEEHNLALRTRRAERLASLGTMAAGLAHEIRNPINAAHLQLNLARRRLTRAGGEPSVIRAIELADSEMTRLAVLVEDFLRFARPQPLRLATGDLRATADATVALVAPEAEALGVAIEIAPGTAVWAEFDDEKMKQVLLNLLRNAIEATEPGGTVAVDVAQRDRIACLDVVDEGPGVPSGAPIFEPFFTTKEQGTGLGLAIVHRIVSDHGGAVEVTSADRGTRFSIWIPLGRTRPPGTAAALKASRAAE